MEECFVAHDLAHQKSGHDAERNQWAFVLSHWEGVREICYEDIVPDEMRVVVLSPLRARYVVADGPLTSFDHTPGDKAHVCYVFGSDHRHLTFEDLGLEPKQVDDVLFIPTDTHHEMYSWVAAAITLYDRAVKRG